MAFGNATKGDLKKISGGGGSGGTSNYNDLSNKPSINGVELTGNKTSAQLNITGGLAYTDVTSDISSGIDISNINAIVIIGCYNENGVKWLFEGTYPISALNNGDHINACDDHSVVWVDVSINNNTMTLSENSQSTQDRHLFKVYTI